MPDARTGVAAIRVRRIREEIELPPDKIRQHLRAAHVEQGPHERPTAIGNAGQARHPGSAQDAKYQGLGLIVGGVAQGYLRATETGGHCLQGGQAHLARRLLRGHMRPSGLADVDLDHLAGDADARAAPANLRGLPARFRSQPVIHHGRRQRDSQAWGQLRQSVHERGRVGAARDGDQHLVARRQQPPLANRGENAG